VRHVAEQFGAIAHGCCHRPAGSPPSPP
jgi:hypothetical protein